jgi:hypothetical protein
MKPIELTATPIEGSPLCFMVNSSEDEQTPHLVDLTRNEGNGYCTCKDFQVRCMSNIRLQKEEYNGKFHRIDYIQFQQVELFNAIGGKKRHYMIAQANPHRTRCKHHIPCLKDVTDPMLYEISQQMHPAI